MSYQYGQKPATQPTNVPQAPTNRPSNQLGGFESDAIRETLLKWSSLGDGR
jgi:hypothetical protein